LHISTGDLFRSEIGHNTELGRLAQTYITEGKLVPDSVTIDMLRKKVVANPDVAGIIFDGFPRTIQQAQALDELLEERETSVAALIALTVDNEEIVSRILNRAKTSGRTDDADEEVIRDRIAIYQSETEPVFAYYDEKNRAFRVKGVGTIEEIFARLTFVVDHIHSGVEKL
ncbi:MAG: adenylate kinase, partial [Saprospiraceae bacterium]|nr:adenylate kinase [Saprospiraceae bacterium]